MKFKTSSKNMQRYRYTIYSYTCRRAKTFLIIWLTADSESGRMGEYSAQGACELVSWSLRAKALPLSVPRGARPSIALRRYAPSFPSI